MPVQKKGFTLVELLVTISIIGILSTIGLVLYSTVLKQSRDSKRQSDLKSIQLALEQYSSDQGYYPGPAVTYINGYLTFGEALRDPAGSKIYINTVPTGSPQYVHVTRPDLCDNTLSSTNKCTSYCLYAKLENPPSPPPIPTSCVGTLPAGYNFVVTPP